MLFTLLQLAVFVAQTESADNDLRTLSIIHVAQEVTAARYSKDGDERTAEYVRKAAATALAVEEVDQCNAFLLGVAIATDRRKFLQRLPIAGDIAKRAAPEKPTSDKLTLRGRDDLAAHFFGSIYLTARLSAQAADAAGLAKELSDADGGSGFSFVDLMADKAGIRFTREVLEKKVSLADLAKSFTVDAYMPDIGGLEEGIAINEFRERYGGPRDPRFARVVDEINRRVDELYKRR